MDPETPVTVAQAFPYANGPTGIGAGNVHDRRRQLHAGRRGAAAALQHAQLMSNALLIGAKRSTSGHPIFVAGPQVGYFSPEILMEEDLHGGGLDARGVAFPGLGFYLQIGRGPDYAWSATSRELRRRSTTSPRRSAATASRSTSTRGSAATMGTLRRRHAEGQTGAPDTELTYRTTVHGPVVGYATSNGKKVAISLDRSTRGRELLGAIPFQTLSTGARAHAAAVLQDDGGLRADVQLVLRRLEAHRDVLERAAAAARPGREPRSADERRTARTSGAAGSRRTRIRTSSIRRAARSSTGTTSPAPRSPRPTTTGRTAPSTASSCSTHGAAEADARRRPRVVSAMNSAATQDLRATLVPAARDVMARTPAPSARDAQTAAAAPDAGTAAASTRTSTGRSTSPAPRSWTRGGRGSRSPSCSRVLGPLTDELKTLAPISDDANSRRQLVRRRAGTATSTRISARAARREPRALTRRGTAATATSRRAPASLWQSLDAAGNALAAAQGPIRGLARRRDDGAHPLLGLHPATRCAGRTARPSSRSWSSARIASLARGGSARSISSRRGRRPCRRRCSPRWPRRSSTTAAPTSARSTSAAWRGCARSAAPSRTSLLFTASGTGAFESAVANLVSPGEPHLVVSAGNFGERWVALTTATAPTSTTCATRGARRPIRTTCARGCASASAKAVWIVQSETSTGVVADVQALAAAAKEAGALVVVDAVSSLGAVPLRDRRVGPRRRRLRLAEGADDAARARPRAPSPRRRSRATGELAALLLRLGADAQGAGEARRCVHAARVARRRRSTSRSACCSRRASTPCSSRHVRLGRAARAGVKAMGLELFSPDEDRSAVVTAVRAPDGIDSARRRQGPARPLRHDDRGRPGRACRARSSASATSAGSTSSTSRRCSPPSSSCSPISAPTSSAASP